MGLFQGGILQIESDGLAELAGARRAQTHYHWCWNTERRGDELTLHAGLSLWFHTSGPKLTASGFTSEISRLCRELLRPCKDTRDVGNLETRRTKWCRRCYKPRSFTRICRQSSQSCLAGQHRTALRCTCATLTVSSGSGRAAENWATVGRGPGLDKTSPLTLYVCGAEWLLLPELTVQPINPWGKREKFRWNIKYLSISGSTI